MSWIAVYNGGIDRAQRLLRSAFPSAEEGYSQQERPSVESGIEKIFAKPFLVCAPLP
jgi:hypothetical protein